MQSKFKYTMYVLLPIYLSIYSFIHNIYINICIYTVMSLLFHHNTYIHYDNLFVYYFIQASISISIYTCIQSGATAEFQPEGH